MKIRIWIASTTHIDRQSQKMSKWCLEWMAEQINSKYIPQLVEHNFDNQIWINLYWEVFILPDWEFALWVVIWIFENDEERVPYLNYEKNLVFLEYRRYFKIDKLVDVFLSKKLESKLDIDIDVDWENDVAFLLEKFLNSTSVSPNWEVYNIKHFIAETNNLKIEVYPKDHYPPHFHVRSKDRKLNARFHLETFDYISTKSWKITDKQIKQIKKFLQNTPRVVEKLKWEYYRFQD